MLIADAAAGATVLYVDDAGDFEDYGSGGWLSINDQVVQYADVDDDAGTITLAAGLSAAADDGDSVYVWSKLYDEAATEKTALVQVDGDDDNTDPVVATLADAVQDLPEGLRGEAGENCTLHQVSADEWEVTAVGGRPSSTKGASAVKFYEDAQAVDSPGLQTIGLTHEPVAHSEHVYWNGLYQPGSEWSRSGLTVTVPDANRDLEAGDQLVVEYAYLVTTSSPDLPLSLGSPGWKYLVIAMSDATNRSAVDFDDSGWRTGQAAFAGTGAGTIPAGSNTYWPVQKGIWLRRTVRVEKPASLVVSGPVDNIVAVYWNGALIGSVDYSNQSDKTYSFTIPAASVKLTNVLAIRAQDDTTDYGTTEGAVIDAAVDYA